MSRVGCGRSGDQFAPDAFVTYALMRELASGVIAIHQSFIGVHGALTSECVLVNDRWQVKISDCGLSMISLQQPQKRNSGWSGIG